MAYLLMVLLSLGIIDGYITQPLGDSCQANEEHLECGPPCAVNCSNMNDPIFCTKPCYSGCFCKVDYVRDGKGNCIHPKDCYKGGFIDCPANEEYVKCVSFCNTCWETRECRTEYCIAGCDCKQGFYRNIYGHCVTSRECFDPYYDFSYRVCGLNEIFSQCVNLCNNCVSRGRCNWEYYCEPGCDCKNGYFRNEKGDCVLENFCDQNISSTQSRGEVSTIQDKTTLSADSTKSTSTVASITEMRPGGKDDKDLPKEETNSMPIHSTQGSPTVASITEMRPGGEDDKDSPKKETNTVPIHSTEGTSTVASITEMRPGGKDNTVLPKEETNSKPIHSTKGTSTVASITEMRPGGKDNTDLPKEETNSMSIHSTKGASTVASITEMRPRGKDDKDFPKEETISMPIQSTKGIPISDGEERITEVPSTTNK